MATQNFRVKNGLEVGIGATILIAESGGNIGIGSTQPTANLDVNGTLNVSGVSTFRNNVDIEGVNSILDVEGRIYTDLIVGNSRELYIRGGGEQTTRPTIHFPNGAVPLSILGNSGNTQGIVINSRSTGAVVIQHNDSTKFETTGYGVTVSGGLNVSGISTLQGDVRVGIDTSQGVILTSPNGTQYRLVVDDSGNLSTSAV